MELTLEQALQKGVEAHKSGKVLEADRYYTAILKTDPRHPDANHNMGVLAVSVGKVEQALPFFKKALEANQSIAQFWLSYISALIKLDRLADAKSVLNQAKSNGAKGDGFDKLEKQLGLSNKKNSSVQDLPRERLQSLVNLYSQGHYQQSLDNASKLLEKFPNSINLYNIVGSANQSLGKLDEAIEAYNKALSIKPDFAEVYSNMGNALKDQGKLDEAIEAYNKALSIKPDLAEPYNNMGNALKQQMKLKEAIEAYNKALSIKSDYAEAYNNMGDALKDQGKLDEAIEAYNRALFIKPDYAEAYGNTGNALKDQGMLDEAIEAYNKALSIKPDLTEAYNNIGNALKERGKLDEAIEAYNKALSIKPDLSETIENLLSLRVQMKDTELMNQDFEKQLESSGFYVTGMPKIQIYQAVRAFLLPNRKLVRKHLNDYSTYTPSVIAKMNAKDKVFCFAYNSFLQKLIETPLHSEAPFTNDQTVFHLGESHCLSYAHQKIKLQGIVCTIAPRITFGAKAYHFSAEKENSFKEITKANLNSLPDKSKVFLSFGEIDCRPNEGLISAAKKHKKSIEDMVADTVRGYFDWFAKQNSIKKHCLFFFNVPAPTFKNKYSSDLNKETVRVVRLFNNVFSEQIKNYDFNMIDIYKFSAGNSGFSNGLFHIDSHHLSCDAIPEIEKYITSFYT